MKKRSASEDELLKELEPTVESLGLDLVDLRFEREQNKLFLRIYLDKRGGISIDELEAASLKLDPVIESLGHTKHDYLTVSSPGLDRPLVSDSDFKRHLGEELAFKFYQKQAGEKEWEAELVDFDQENFKLRYQDKEEVLPRTAVAQVKQIIRFN
ncbi:MAG: ribosome maturation factor RimP [Eubacteriales bacterium]|nr:ribosome maturation factor RimP [Eubacteriales bacterium]